MKRATILLYFYAIIAIIYSLVFLLSGMNAFVDSIHKALSIFISITPVFFIVFAIMIITEYAVTKEAIKKHITDASSIKRWVIAISGGIISTGPAYMWFPLFKSMREKGISYGFISTFLYSRAIKPALLPFLIYYFGLKYTIVLTTVMIVASVIQGVVFDILDEKRVIQ